MVSLSGIVETVAETVAAPLKAVAGLARRALGGEGTAAPERPAIPKRSKGYRKHLRRMKAQQRGRA